MRCSCSVSSVRILLRKSTMRRMVSNAASFRLSASCRALCTSASFSFCPSVSFCTSKPAAVCFFSKTSYSSVKETSCFSRPATCCSSFSFCWLKRTPALRLCEMRSSKTAPCPRTFSSAVSLTFISSCNLL